MNILIVEDDASTAEFVAGAFKQVGYATEFAAALAATRAGRALVSWTFRQEPDPGRCNGCGLCAKVCPCSNIEIADGRARIRDRARCAHCMACVHFCPRQAMTIRGRRVRPELQYRHPGVTAADLFA